MNDTAAPETKGYKWVGTRPIRPDGVPKVTGTAMYGSDMWYLSTSSGVTKPGAKECF